MDNKLEIIRGQVVIGCCRKAVPNLDKSILFFSNCTREIEQKNAIQIAHLIPSIVMTSRFYNEVGGTNREDLKIFSSKFRGHRKVLVVNPVIVFNV